MCCTDGSESGSPRPLSKVRTNFVAIEKNGRMGLQREHSGDSDLSRRRMSSETADTETNTTGSERHKTKNHSAAPTSPIPSVYDTACESTGQIATESNTLASLDKSTAVEVSGIFPKLDSDHRDDQQKVVGVTAKLPMVEQASRKPTVAPSDSNKKLTKQHISRPQAARPLTEGSKKSTTKRLPMTGSRAVTKEKTATLNTSNTSVPRQARDPSVAIAKGKPTPKSPAKPVHLPSSLTAPNLSSESRVGVPRQSLSTQSARQQKHDATSQNVGRASLPGPSLSALSMNRLGSVSSRNRPSLGPPPIKPALSENTGKKQQLVDEGFLARMMRPTQSSSYKATERAIVTPTKKTQPRRSAGLNRDKLPGDGISNQAKNQNVSLKDDSITRPAAVDSPQQQTSVELVGGPTSDIDAATSPDGQVSPISAPGASNLVHNETAEDMSQPAAESAQDEEEGLTRNSHGVAEDHTVSQSKRRSDYDRTVECGEPKDEPVQQDTDLKLEVRPDDATDTYAKRSGAAGPEAKVPNDADERFSPTLTTANKAGIPESSYCLADQNVNKLIDKQTSVDGAACLNPAPLEPPKDRIENTSDRQCGPLLDLQDGEVSNPVSASNVPGQISTDPIPE